MTCYRGTSSRQAKSTVGASDRLRKGRLVLPAPEDPVEFAALLLGPAEDAPRADVGAVARPEIVAGAVVIRLEAGASAERIAMVVRALAATP